MKIHLLGPQLLYFIVTWRGGLAIAIRVAVRSRIGARTQLAHTAIRAQQRQLRRGEKIRLREMTPR